MIGKTTMPEFAWKVTTDSPLFGVTRTLTIVAAAEAVHAIDPRRDHRRGGRHDDQRPLAPRILIGRQYSASRGGDLGWRMPAALGSGSTANRSCRSWAMVRRCILPKLCGWRPTKHSRSPSW